MTVKNWMLCGVMVLGLAACSQEAEPDRLADEAEVAVAQDSAAGQSEIAAPEAKPEEEEAQADEVETSQSPAATPETPAPLSSIPAEFLGVWDAETGTCSRESDLRLEISSQEIVFYESFGQVVTAKRIGEATVEIALAMQGEGQTWSNTERLTVSGDGQTLTLAPVQGETASDTIPRKKCPQ